MCSAMNAVAAVIAVVDIIIPNRNQKLPVMQISNAFQKQLHRRRLLPPRNKHRNPKPLQTSLRMTSNPKIATRRQRSILNCVSSANALTCDTWQAMRDSNKVKLALCSAIRMRFEKNGNPAMETTMTCAFACRRPLTLNWGMLRNSLPPFPSLLGDLVNDCISSK